MSLSGPSSTFQLTISLSNAEKNDQKSTFKQDGQRFGTSPRTLKFYSDTKYRIHIKTKPPVEFHSLQLAGCDLELITDHPQSGDYNATWNTTGINPTKKGSRQDCLLVLMGPGGTLKKKLQTKFYPKDSSRAEYGHKLGGLVWNCSVDATGNATVTDEQVL
ncbi:Protein F29A7.4 [Aphelenchoides avenae]|nr:Protein F29A7.4 [Aphelenchus avenae]